MSSLPLPTITLPTHITPHLRALIYASSPGTIITNLTLSQPPNQTISLTQLPPTIPLHHPPLPRTPPNKIFFNTFPLTAYLQNQAIVFTTTLPHVTADLSEPVPLPDTALSTTPLCISLKSRTTHHTHGLLKLSAGRYEPVIENCRDIVGAWGKDHPVFLNAGLLQLSRYLYRRCNRRLGNTRVLRKQIVLIKFAEDGVYVVRGWINVDGVRKWICRVPIRGGVGEFRVEEVESALRSRGRERVRSSVVDTANSVSDHTHFVEEVVATNDREVVEEEFMVAKMREFNFGHVEEISNENAVERESTEVSDVDEEITLISPQLRVQQVDLDSLNNETCTTTTSSDDETEEAMLETLCKQYLNHGWEESINRELSRLQNTPDERR